MPRSEETSIADTRNRLSSAHHRLKRSLLRQSRSSSLEIVENPDEPLPPAAHTNDGFFKAIFSQPQHATAFFKSHLPAEIVAQIDWPSLAVMPGSFVKTNLQKLHSDLLFPMARTDSRL